MNLLDEERGLLLTKMADDTVASILDRPEKWVRKARAFLAKEAEPPKRRGRKPKLEVVQGGKVEPVEISPLDHLPHPEATWTVVKDGAPYTETNEAAPNDVTYIAQAEPGAVFPFPDIPAPAAIKVERVFIHPAPLPPRVARWCGWFLKAGWTRAEVAHLFDIKVAQLQEVAVA